MTVIEGWPAFYREVGQALRACGTELDSAFFEALAPTEAAAPPRHVDFPSTRADRMWTLHDQLKSGELRVPGESAGCVANAVKLWEIRIEDLEQASMGVTISGTLIATGIVVLGAVYGSMPLLALIPLTVTLVNGVDIFYRRKTKRALQRITRLM